MSPGVRHLDRFILTDCTHSTPWVMILSTHKAHLFHPGNVQELVIEFPFISSFPFSLLLLNRPLEEYILYSPASEETSINPHLLHRSIMSHPVPRRRSSAAVVNVDGPERLSPLTPSITSSPEGRLPEDEVESNSVSATSTVVELKNEPSNIIPDQPIFHRGGSRSSSTFEKPVPGSESSVNRKPVLSKPEPGLLIKFLTWFSPYRRLFLICVLVNTLGIVLVEGKVWSYPLRHLTTFVLGNMVCSVLVRNEFALRLFYWVTIKLLAKWSPLRLRLAIVGLLYHIGGLHSGCGIASGTLISLMISSVASLLIFLVLVTLDNFEYGNIVFK